MHQNIHDCIKNIHSTYVHTVIKEKRKKKVRKKNRPYGLCKMPFTLIFQVYNAGNNYDTCNKNTL